MPNFLGALVEDDTRNAMLIQIPNIFLSHLIWMISLRDHLGLTISIPKAFILSSLHPQFKMVATPRLHHLHQVMFFYDRMWYLGCLLCPLLPARPLNGAGTYHISVASGLAPKRRNHINDLSSHPRFDSISSSIARVTPILMSQLPRDHQQIMSNLRYISHSNADKHK